MAYRLQCALTVHFSLELWIPLTHIVGVLLFSVVFIKWKTPLWTNLDLIEHFFIYCDKLVVISLNS